MFRQCSFDPGQLKLIHGNPSRTVDLASFWMRRLVLRRENDQALQNDSRDAAASWEKQQEAPRSRRSSTCESLVRPTSRRSGSVSLCMILQACAEGLAVLDHFLLLRVFLCFLHWLQSCVPGKLSGFLKCSSWFARCHGPNLQRSSRVILGEFCKAVAAEFMFACWESCGIWRSAVWRGRHGKGDQPAPPANPPQIDS